MSDLFDELLVPTRWYFVENLCLSGILAYNSLFVISVYFGYQDDVCFTKTIGSVYISSVSWENLKRIVFRKG